MSALQFLPSMVPLANSPGTFAYKTKKVECVAPSKCPICGFFADRMVEAMLRESKSLTDTLELVARFASYSPEAQIDILKRVEESRR